MDAHMSTTVRFVLYRMAITYSKGKEQPGKDVNPACAQLSRENDFLLVPVRA